MKRKGWYIFGGIVLFLGVVGCYIYFNFLSTMNSLRDVRLSMAGFESNTIQLDSSNVFYYQGGEGKKTVLFIHGFGLGGATTWFDPMLDLDDSLQMIVPDLLWFGGSSSTVAPSLPNQAKTMWELCDKLHIQPDAIVGISYGGFVAFEMMHQRPQGANKLVIVNSPGPCFQQKEITELCERAQVNSPDELFIPNDKSKLKHLFQFVFSEEPPIPEFVYDEIFEKETQKNADIKRNLMKDLVNNSEVYRNSGYPKDTKNGVIWSRKDQVFPIACGERLADSLHAEMVVMENSGHVPHPRERKVYLAALRKFLLN